MEISSVSLEMQRADFSGVIHSLETGMMETGDHETTIGEILIIKTEVSLGENLSISP